MTDSTAGNAGHSAGKGAGPAIAARALAFVIGAGMLATAAIMLCRPMLWYGGFPRVSETGPFNPHFVRDIAAAYLAVALTLLASSLLPRPPLGALLAVSGFLAMHAVIHL
jgi:hypothetical protein